MSFLADRTISAGLATTRNVAVIVASVLVLAACSEPDEQPLQFDDRTESVCDGGAGVYEIAVEPTVTDIGPSANDIASFGDTLWIVESQANTVSRFDVDTGRYEGGFVHVGGNRNPYAVAVDDVASELWIANYLSDTVTVADADTGEVIEELDDESFDSPSAISLTDDYAYVGNVAFRGGDEGFGPGSISVVDRSSNQVVNELDTAFENPQFSTIATIEDQTALLVTGSGAYDVDGETAQVSSEGGLQWFSIEEDPTDPPGESFPIGQREIETVGAPGRALVDPHGERLYFSSGVAPAVFSFDIDQRRWIDDAADPIELYDADGDATHRAAIGPAGLMWITAFNEDALYLLDTTCDAVVAGPIDLGNVADMLEGPHDLTVVQNGERLEAYYLSSLANSLGRIVLRPEGASP